MSCYRINGISRQGEIISKEIRFIRFLEHPTKFFKSYEILCIGPVFRAADCRTGKHFMQKITE